MGEDEGLYEVKAKMTGRLVANVRQQVSSAGAKKTSDELQEHRISHNRLFDPWRRQRIPERTQIGAGNSHAEAAKRTTEGVEWRVTPFVPLTDAAPTHRQHASVLLAARSLV
ncbi:unnamed protein product [Caenorhabditis auriculariae]|uniref:Uncharacterized protein n=1 Tax=Caenorhabditis auriculariae TaxID=2777116 RepID=A0A8S1H906_9PELO|nr:unnamed protein product [Caenorhabditis auriculariae]